MGPQAYQPGCAVSDRSHGCSHRSHRSQRTPPRFSHGCRIQNGATSMRVPSLPFALGPLKGPQQERPDTFKAQAPEMIENGLPRREVGWEVAKGGNPCAARRRWHQKWRAGSELAVCHVWVREEDSVAAFPTLCWKDCLDNWFSSTQFITREAFTHFQNTL